MRENNSYWLKNFFRFLMNFLEKTKFSIKLEASYIQDKNYILTQEILDKKKKANIYFESNLWKIIGIE
jgi:hypothetical protein